MLHDARSVLRVAELIRSERPHILHTHTAKAGAIARAAALARRRRAAAGRRCTRSTVTSSRATSAAARTAFFRQVERTLARASDVLVAVSPEVRDELVELGVAPHEKFAVIRLGIPLEERLGGPTADADYRRLYGIPPRRVRRRLGRAHDGSEGDGRGARDRARRARSAESTRCCAWSETGPTASGSSSWRTSSGSRGTATSSATRRMWPATTACSTRSSCPR